METDQHPPTFSSNRLNRLISETGAKTYLEIGVWRGDTFQAVQAAQKVGVDPNPLFVWEPAHRPGIDFYKLTSDAFLGDRRALDYRFDVAFIDGLHEYQQTLKDFLGVMALSGPNAIWVIDDTHPSDFFSAMPDAGQCFSARREVGLESLAWHGDVFKVVFAIHDLFPGLTYCTTSTGGNQQTIVWREPRATYAPRFKNLEAIGRSDYFGFKANIDLLNLMPEEDALARAIEGVSRKR